MFLENMKKYKIDPCPWRLAEIETDQGTGW
jgi:hypothetical protein